MSLTDARLKELLDREAHKARIPYELEELVVNRSRRARRVVGAVALCLMALLAGVGAVVSSRLSSPHTIPPAGSSGWGTYRDARMGWSLRYPSAWHVQPYDDTIGGRFRARGVLISNVAQQFHHQTCGTGCTTSAWDVSGLPAGQVTLTFEYHAGGLGVANTSHRDTRFPLQVKGLAPMSQQEVEAPEVTGRWRPVWVNGRDNFALYAYTGSNVSRPAAAALRHIVGSITAPRPQGWRSRSNDSLGVSVNFPRSWHWDTFEGVANSFNQSDDGFIVSNNPAGEHIRPCGARCPHGWTFRNFSPGSMAVVLQDEPTVAPNETVTPPLRRGDLVPGDLMSDVPFPGLPPGTRVWSGSLARFGWPRCTVYVLQGSRASKDGRATLRTVVASVARPGAGPKG